MTLQYNSTTTLNEIRDQSPCADGWQKLLTHLGKTKPDDEPLSVLTVLESNGLDDALWCLQCKSLERLSRHFQAWCAEQVLHIFENEHPDDMRVRNQIAMLRNDNASDEDRRLACDSAWAAAWADASDEDRRVASDAAWVAARAAARDASSAARAAACDAARAATWDAARVAARDAAMVAAWDAARDASSAARAAARDAAMVAACADAMVAASDAAWDAACDAQEEQLRKMIKEEKSL